MLWRNSLDRSALPCRVVGILDRQFAQDRDVVFGKGLVQCLEFRQEDPIERNTVENDVVQREKQPVFLIAETNKAHAVHWAFCKIERLQYVGRRQTNGF